MHQPKLVIDTPDFTIVSDMQIQTDQQDHGIKNKCYNFIELKYNTKRIQKVRQVQSYTSIDPSLPFPISHFQYHIKASV